MAGNNGDGPGCGCVALVLLAFVAVFSMGRVKGIDEERAKAAEAGVGRWEGEGVERRFEYGPAERKEGE